MASKPRRQRDDQRGGPVHHSDSAQDQPEAVGAGNRRRREAPCRVQSAEVGDASPSWWKKRSGHTKPGKYRMVGQVPQGPLAIRRGLAAAAHGRVGGNRIPPLPLILLQQQAFQLPGPPHWRKAGRVKGPEPADHAAEKGR